MANHLIENTTGSDIEINDIGITVPANSTYDLTGKPHHVIEQSDELITHLTSGDIKLIKSEGPTVYYTSTQAIRIIHRSDDGINAGGTSGQLLCTNPSGDLVWTTSVGGTVVFFNDGIASNKWMKIIDASGRTSDLSPYVFPFDAVIYGLSFSNHLDSRSSDIEFYKNESLLFTWSIVDKRWAYKTNGLSSLTFSAGDRLSIFMSDTGSDPNDALLTVFFSFLSGAQGEGGAEFG